MSDVITGVGEYRTQDGSRATVEFISKTEWAFGQIDRLACFWWVKNGKSPDYIAHGGRCDITGPFVPPRNPAERIWISWKEASTDPLVFKSMNASPLIGGDEYRRVDPKAEQEAREKIEFVISQISAVGYGRYAEKLYDALSLLFPDAS